MGEDFVKRLREKERTQRLLMEAVDQVALDRKRRRLLAAKWSGVAALLAVMVYMSVDSLFPSLGALWAEAKLKFMSRLDPPDAASPRSLAGGEGKAPAGGFGSQSPAAAPGAAYLEASSAQQELILGLSSLQGSPPPVPRRDPASVEQRPSVLIPDSLPAAKGPGPGDYAPVQTAPAVLLELQSGGHRIQ